MMYTEFNVGDKEYKLRLDTKNIIALEKKIKCNPIMVFGTGIFQENPEDVKFEIPTYTHMTAILHQSLQPYHHGISFEDACNIFTEWLSEGHTLIEFSTVIMEIYQTAGIFPKEEAKDESEKN